jgi:hypothetical protein
MPHFPPVVLPQERANSKRAGRLGWRLVSSSCSRRGLVSAREMQANSLNSDADAAIRVGRIGAKGEAETTAATPHHHDVMPLIRLSNHQLEAIAQKVTVLDDNACARARDTLDVAFDGGEFRIQ